MRVENRLVDMDKAKPLIILNPKKNIWEREEARKGENKQTSRNEEILNQIIRQKLR